MNINTLIKRNEFNNGMYVELHDYSNWKENPEEYLAQIATLSWGKHKSKNAKHLWKRLKTESIGKPSSVFEFLWRYVVFIDGNFDDDIFKYGIDIDENQEIENYRGYFNMRTLLENHNDLSNEYIDSKDWIKHNVFTFKIKVPIYIMRQLIRHRNVSYNEISLRRVKTGIEFHIPERIDQYNITIPDGYTTDGCTVKVSDEIKEINNNLINSYNNLLSNKIPPELARIILPLSTMTTVWVQYTNTNNSWENLLKLRLDSHAQPETREVVQNMKDLIESWLNNN